MGGIFAGGLLSVVLAVVVLPRSASVESLREMKKALKAMYDLNKEVRQDTSPRIRGGYWQRVLRHVGLLLCASLCWGGEGMYDLNKEVGIA